MFEYTALVDAPTQRFTGIVTGSDPDDDPSAPRPPDGFAAPAAPRPDAPMPLAIETREPVAIETREPVAIETREPAAIETREPSGDQRAAGPAPASAEVRPTAHHRAPARPEATSRIALGPALVAIAAAAVTAMWWVRRDSHDR